MRDIKITILSDGTAQIEEPFCFCGEHNAARLCITLNDELKTDASYYLLSFDVYGLSRRIVSNIISGANSTPAYITGGVIYCPLPEALTSTGELTVQVEAHKRNDLEVTRITKSAVFTLGFEPSVMGIDGELEEECGILPELAAAVESMRDLKALFGGTTDLKAVIINSLGFTPQASPTQYTLQHRAGVSDAQRQCGIPHDGASDADGSVSRRRELRVLDAPELRGERRYHSHSARGHRIYRHSAGF